LRSFDLDVVDHVEVDPRCLHQSCSHGRSLPQDGFLMDALDPIEQFQGWLAEAEAAGEAEPTAMTLATASAADGAPSARMVLLKGVDERGFVFYTNYRSRKGQELAANPAAALVFRWPVLHRQVTVTGSVTQLPAEESDAYFATRDRGSQIGAWASNQSEVLPGGRAELEERVAAVEARFAGRADVPRPPHWGGYLVAPDTIVFWTGRPNRLHDRQRFTRNESVWRSEVLSP
jgi:pyridoxamine 5'-phosphate oxidase